MSLQLPNLRGTGRRRATDKVTELRAENVKLLTLLAGADDYFMLLDQHRKELETEVEQLQGQVAEERSARIAVGKDRDALERYVHDLEKQLTESRERLEVRSWAEHVIAETQPIPVVTRVLPLHEAPFATVDPGRVRPSWAKGEEMAP